MTTQTGANTIAGLIRRAESGKDSYGKTTFTETIVVLPGIFWPEMSSELLFQQDQVDATAAICLPAGTDVSAIDAVIPELLVDADGQPVPDEHGGAQGERFEVRGKPQVWPKNPFTKWVPPFPVVLALNEVSG